MYITQHKYSIERLPEATIGGGKAYTLVLVAQTFYSKYQGKRIFFHLNWFLIGFLLHRCLQLQDIEYVFRAVNNGISKTLDGGSNCQRLAITAKTTRSHCIVAELKMLKYQSESQFCTRWIVICVPQ